MAVTQIDSVRTGAPSVSAPPTQAPITDDEDAAEAPLGVGAGAVPSQARDLGAEGALSPPRAERRLDAGARQRRVAQSVALSLAAAPEDLRDSADGVLAVVRDHNRFVARSSVSGGDPGVDGAELGRASFRLRFPAARLQTALAALSELGHLVSRTDGTRDITARFARRGS